MQGTVVRPADSKPAPTDKEKADAEAEAERVSPPSNIIGSYLVCMEQERFDTIQQSATIHCGVYRQPAQTPISVTYLKQWQVTGSVVVLQTVAPASASVVELRFQATDLNGLKQSIRKTKLSVKDDAGTSYDGFVAELLPSDSRFSVANANKPSSFVPLWNEGFEGTRITTDTALFHDPKTFAASTTLDWVNPGTQNTACGLPVFEVMRFATQAGSTDTVGAAEGQQFIDTDSVCWPEGSANPIRGASNLVLRKDLVLIPGRVYRISFKVRQQPLPPGFAPTVQGLQLKINQTLVKDLRTFSNVWQDVTLDWVAGSGTSKIEWIDVGAADDSIGILLDDLRVQGENF
ncbi:MAG TPA: hypothetical protein VE954_01950 [Oligoflexus sp.]|uniref:hypothetical protein n=1 Tax=Oligoflexus sp. TaxID=1971216 RepID=UPI002D6C0BF9|nr:hypothetical protein [Oligoflexus sp.]HYX31848.1 hypothetical protein [Oligoflexus sp.]